MVRANVGPDGEGGRRQGSGARPEEIMGTLREPEVPTVQGKSVAKAATATGRTAQSHLRRRTEHGDLKRTRPFG